MIYFDNSAATYPKPKECNRNIDSVFENYSFNIGRGGYKEALRSAEKIYQTRSLAASFFGVKENCIIFTKNCTEALNYAIKGIAEKGDHFIISSFEHNSVLRVINKLFNDGVCEYDIAEFSFIKEEQIEYFKKLIKSNTKAIICTVSSNVFGCVTPYEEIGKICKEFGINFILDASQGAGLFELNLKRQNIDILCTSGQKSLYGPMGSGILAINGVKLNTLVEGGTGSKSLDYNQPEFLPDRFESGTLNVPSIILLGKGIDYINNIGVDNIYKVEMNILRYFYDSLSEIKDVELYTPYPENYNYSPIISFNYKDYSSEKTAALLADKRICTRGGYHCSPLAHKTFNTLERGTVRISLGCFNSKKECDKFINVLKKL